VRECESITESVGERARSRERERERQIDNWGETKVQAEHRKTGREREIPGDRGVSKTDTNFLSRTHSHSHTRTHSKTHTTSNYNELTNTMSSQIHTRAQDKYT